jgi:adenosine deaminase
MGLSDALARFALTLSVLQEADAVARIAGEICEDAAREGVSVLEIRFAPQLHGGAPPEEIVDAAIDGIAGRAGLILCGLYGEPPSVLEHHVEIARTRRAVVGIDLAGGPTPSASFSLSDYAAPYTRARDLGIGRTVHASEGRAPIEIRIAVEQLHAQRIGHGTTLLEDRWVLDLVIEREVVIEACPSSNVHTGVITAVEEHPLAKWLELGVNACVCTDNTLFSDVDAPREHENARRIVGMTDALLKRAIEIGRRSRFTR